MIQITFRIILITVMYIGVLMASSYHVTYAYFSDRAIANDHKFTAALSFVTPTPTPGTNCLGNITTVINGNGAKSKNKVEIIKNCSTTIHQNNSTNVTNIVNSSANTGSNTSSHNTGSSTVNTSTAVSSVTTSTVLGTNTVSTGNTTVTTNQVTETQTIVTPTPIIVHETAPEASGSGSVE
jgi:hypothetical protein